MIKRENTVNCGISGGILALTMGLGKTLAALSVSYLNKKNIPTLIIVPLTLMLNWKKEIEKMLISCKILFYHRDYMSAKLFSDMSVSEILQYDFVITTYEVITKAYTKGNYSRFIRDLGTQGMVPEK